MRLIDADELKKAIKKELPQMSNWGETFIPLLIDEAPTVETSKIEHKAYNDGFKDGVDQGIKLSEKPQGKRAEGALSIIDRLYTEGHINNIEQGILRRVVQND